MNDNDRAARDDALAYANNALTLAAETYIVALDVSEQTWRKECAAADAALADALRRVDEAATVLDNLMDYYIPCDKDEGRDYCMTHHNFKCEGDAWEAKSREVLARLDTA